jgi:hypothetical protein
MPSGIGPTAQLSLIDIFKKDYGVDRFKGRAVSGITNGFESAPAK